MKKLLSLLVAFFISGNCLSTVVACNGKYDHKLKSDLSNYLKVTNLGSIRQSFAGATPTIKEVTAAVAFVNPDINTHYLTVDNPTLTTALVHGDNLHYTGQLPVTFSLPEHIEISSIVPEGTYIGQIIAPGQGTKATSAAIKEQLGRVFANLNTDKVTVTVAADQNQATITGDGITYDHSVVVNYTLDNAVNLHTVITKNAIGTIKTKGELIPADASIKSALKTLFSDLVTSKIAISKSTATSAQVQSADESFYNGPPINITFDVDATVPLNSVITDTALGTLGPGHSVQPDVAEIKQALKSDNLNPDLNVNYINITDITDESFNISSANQTIYTDDSIKVTYTLNTVTDLSKYITDCNLGTFKFSLDKTIPTEDDIKNALKDYQLQWDKLKITGITSTQAVISSTDETVYINSVTLIYTIDNSTQLSQDLTNTDLGTVNSNGLLNLTQDQFLTALTAAKGNESLKTDYVTVTINDGSAAVAGDGTHYIGDSINVTFTVDSSTITNPIAYSDSKDYSATTGGKDNTFDGTDQVLLTDWTQYCGNNWNDFVAKFPKLSFGANASLKTWMNNWGSAQLTGDQLSYDVNKINTDKTNTAFSVKYYYNAGWWSGTVDLKANIRIWHDDTKIYLSWDGSMSVSSIVTRNSQFSINLPEASFHK